MHVLIMAKSPEPGRVKTRLCPPCTPGEAADLAAAALADTFAAACEAAPNGVVLALDGEPGPWVPPDVTVITQRGRGFDERLANAWSDVDGPGVQIGMDTPQVTAGHLSDAMAALAQSGVDAVVGPATDGGWWLIGLREPRRDVFVGVPMSTSDTLVHQRARLDDLGLRAVDVDELTDVDTIDDARAVAAAAPTTAFAHRFTAQVARR